MDAKGFELLMSAKILGEGGGGIAMDAKGFERLMAAKILGKGSGGKIKELEGAPPLTFTANGEPLLDYLISGNTVQTGTPTPENPIIPIGCGERTENLFDRTGEIYPYFINDGGVISSISSGWFVSDFIQVQPNATYTFTYNSPPGAAGYHAFYNENKELISTIHMGILVFNTPNDAKYMRFSYRQNSFNIMLNEGSTPLPYEPYGYKLPILSNSTVTNIYLGEVETTRRIKKLVLNGTENWSYEGEFERFKLLVEGMYSSGRRTTPVVCTHYQCIYDGRPVEQVPYDTVYIGDPGTSVLISIKTRTYTTLTDFKAYLAQQYAAGTPVTIWYILAEPETGIVNEPLMKIGDYADTVSMEQAGVSIPTNKGSTTLDVDTTIKPSNVYIKYRS